MRVDKQLLIAGSATDVADYALVLRENAVGIGHFVVKSAEGLRVGAGVKFSAGVSAIRAGEMTPVFDGVIVRVTAQADSYVRLDVKEVTHVLDFPCPLALRHVTADQVLGAISAQTGLVVQMQPQAERLPFFYHVGDGLTALQQVGRTFNLPDFFWQMNADGTLWAGDWRESLWAAQDLPLAEHFFKTVGAARKLIMLPRLRPGAMLNGRRVRSIFFSGDFMELRYA